MLIIGSLDRGRDRHPAIRLRLIGILDSIRDIIHQAELDDRGVDFELGQIVGDANFDAFGFGRVLQLANRFAGRLGEHDVAAVSRIGLGARQGLEVRQHALQGLRIPRDYFVELLPVARRDPFLGKGSRCSRDRAHVVLQFVGDGSIEFSQPVLPLVDLRGR